jgi:hypothetical protein
MDVSRYILVLDTSVFVKDNILLRPILLFANTDISTTQIYLNTSVLTKSIIDHREYIRGSRKKGILLMESHNY